MTPDEKLKALKDWMGQTFPELHIEIKWNEPMYVLGKTFILAFNGTKKHLSVAPEQDCLNYFESKIQSLGLSRTKELLTIPWDQPIPYDLLKEMVEFNIREKEGMTRFWR